VAAADMRLVNGGGRRDVLGGVGGRDAVVPIVGSRREPLHAVYGPAVAIAARRQIGRGQLKIALACEGLDVVRVPEAELRELDPGLRSFRNVNTPEDYAGARRDAGA